MSQRMLLTDVEELVLVRRRLPLKAEWLLDRLKLFSVATDPGAGVHVDDLRFALDDRKMSVAEAMRMLDVLDRAGLVDITADGVIEFYRLQWREFS